MYPTCSRVKTSAENLQEYYIESSSSFRDCEVSKEIQYTSDTNIKIIVTPSMKDVQITEIQNISLVQNKSVTDSGCNWKLYLIYVKLTALTVLWLLSGVLIARNVSVKEHHQIDIPKGQIKAYTLKEIPLAGKLSLALEGALVPPYYSNLSSNHLYVWVQFDVLVNPLANHLVKESNVLLSQNISEIWKVPIVSENLIGVVPEVQQNHVFKLSNFSVKPFTSCVVQIKMMTNLNANLPLAVAYNVRPINMDDGIIYAAIVLIGLYVLIIFDVIHRSVAAILASTVAVAILAALNARPTMAEIVSWVDMETLLLLFSMMTIVSITSETGIFEYIAVWAYKLTNGKEWPLINTLCFITVLVSCFLDNVTTGLLMTPITIRLCEVTKLNPIPVLICMVIYSNIGGAITPIGDPPNVIITSNVDVMEAGVNFATFTLHMGGGTLLVSIFVYIQLRYMFRNPKDLRYKEPEEVLELKREIAVCQRTADCMSSYSKNEDSVKETLKKRSIRLLEKLNKTQIACLAVDNYANNLETLQLKYPIRNKVLLIKSGCILLFVVTLFFLHSIPGMSSLGLSGTAFLGAVLLILLYDRDDIETVLSRVEWSTLVFFGSLFILMEALAKLGLIDWIGRQTQFVIMSVEQESRLAVALLLILWVSAVVSTFVDNIPLTTMMIKVATVLADDVELQLPLKPLVWALSFGACFGGNGTLFASSSNIVCAGVAERHGYKFTFMQFLKIGCPVTITSLIVITVYLMVVHIGIGWQ